MYLSQENRIREPEYEQERDNNVDIMAWVTHSHSMASDWELLWLSQLYPFPTITPLHNIRELLTFDCKYNLKRYFIVFYLAM